MKLARRQATVLSTVFLVSCVGHSDRIAAPTRVVVSSLTLADRQKVPLKIQNAGCSVGQALSESSSRIRVVSREELPVQLPVLSAMPLNAKGYAPFTVRSFRFGGDAGAGSVVVTCLTPFLGDYGTRLASVMRDVPLSRWQAILANRHAEIVNAPLSDALPQELFKATFPKAKKVGASNRNTASKNIGSGTLPTVHIYAGYNYGATWISMSQMTRFFDEWDEMNALKDEFYDEEWAEACDTYNSEFWKWYDTHAQAAAALEALESAFADLASAMGSATDSLEAAVSVPCPPTGKPMCLDAYIPSCWILNGAGDCRESDPNATASQSRMQIEFDPGTKAFTFTYSGSIVMLPCVQAISPIVVGSVCLFNFRDSAQFAGNGAISVTDGPNGSVILDVNVGTSACSLVPSILGIPGTALCPDIDTKVTFTPDATKPNGWAASFADSDGAPQWDVFARVNGQLHPIARLNAPRNAVAFLLTLTGAINKVKNELNNPPPDAPLGCDVY